MRQSDNHSIIVLLALRCNRDAGSRNLIDADVVSEQSGTILLAPVLLISWAPASPPDKDMLVF